MIDIQYLSEYKEGTFGSVMDLLMDGPRLPSRSAILVDKQGIILYIQFVPIVSSLSDMKSFR